MHCINSQKEIALNAILPVSGNLPHSTTKNLQLQVENSASVATKPIDPMTGCTRASLQTALNAILQVSGSPPHSITKSLLL
jgi:hypothetical protein